MRLHSYLRILFPLAVIGVSVVQLLIHNILRAVRLKRSHRYQPVANSATPTSPSDHTAIPADEDPTSESDDDDVLTMSGGRLALAKTSTRGSIVQADNPPGQTLSVVVEVIAIAALVAINALALVRGVYGNLTAIVGLTVWTYVLILASLRLFLGNTQWRVPRIWNHTAAIYSLQWLFTVIIFRSAIIHPSSDLTRMLVIAEFALTSLVFVIAISTRKGNKTVLLEWEDGIEPGREELASLFSHYTFGWVDSIIWKGWKETMDITKVWNLIPKEKSAVILANYRQFKKTTSLAVHLVKHFKGMLVMQSLWAVLGGAMTFVPTLLLKAILEYVEDPAVAPKNVLWLYVILLPASDLVRSVADGQALWIGRKICIRIRAILVGEIYAKALRRKASAGKDTVLGDKDKKAAEESKEKTGFLARVKKALRLGQDDKKADADASANGAVPATGPDDKKAKAGESDEQANLGTIINLMSVDSFKVAEITAYLHFLVAAAPTQLIVSIVLLYQVMGYSAIPGFIVMCFLLPINIGFARGFASTQKKIMAATDKRINATNEILQNIRIIKYFAWEHRFGVIVDEKRRNELKALRNRFLLWAVAVGVWNTVPIVITFFSFFFYTVIEDKPLYPSVAFTAISLFMLLRYPLDQLGDMIAHVQESKVSIDRIEEFLSEEETDKFEQLGRENIDENGNRVIGFRDATFIWGSKTTVAEDGSMAFRLLDLDVEFQIGKLNVITGPTGCGKSSMLMALLGEMTVMKGRVYLPGGRSREDVRPDPETGLAETCAYVAQQAWLVNASIKENILFSAPFDEERYKDVIVACALEHDLEILDNGDETLVGEKGITLSGGQKQRISLARAVYSNSKHILLDDCLSAVDSHTAQWIFSNCLMGPLMRHRTCILVSHNIQLCVPLADYVVTMSNGRITGKGSAAEVIASGKLGDELLQKSVPGSAHVSRVPSRVPSSVGEESGAATLINEPDGSGQPAKAKVAKKEIKKQDAMDENKAVGAVQWPVLKLYLQAMGKWWFWVVAVSIFAAQQLLSVATSIWIKIWANEYLSDETEGVVFSTNSHSYSSQSMSPTYFASVATYGNANTTNFSAESTPEVNVRYYLFVLAMIGVASAISAFARDLWIFFGSLNASWKIHERLMGAVTGARFKFFDTTPLGQMMNRFSKDLEGIDQEVAPVAIGVFSCALGIIVTITLIAWVTPGFLLPGFFITLAYVFLGNFYLHSSRDLKRLESVERSPLFQQFGETLSGVTTIRAYSDERRFVRDNLARINKQSRPFIYLWAANRWLAFRTDVLGDLVSFFAGVFVILSLGKIDPGSAGISLSYAIGFAENILWLVRLYSMNEQNMNSVERIKEYLDVEQEAPAIVEKNRPAENWPANGSVEFVNYTTSYRKELDPVLRNLTFKIDAQEKVGIVGRTGAGKSSLALAVLRCLEADGGKILVDDVDIGLIGLRDLREAITIVPQEPTLFMGTIRTNLDPFNIYTDDQVFAALRRVQLIGPDDEPATVPATPAAPVTPTINLINVEEEGARSATPTNKNVFLNLSSPVTESGNNLSQGQRQLLCLARALLKNPRVLVMDEATASIDYATDAAIQKTIHELTSTIITIAHRLQTVVDYDKVLVLDKGEVVEYGHPYDLIKKEGGSFRGMCEMSGDLDGLIKAAKKAYKAKQLVDVDDEEEVDVEAEAEAETEGETGKSTTDTATSSS